MYIWEIDHFVIKSDILGGFFNFKTILKLSCYHDNTSCLEFSKERVSACMYFLVKEYKVASEMLTIIVSTKIM
jgi:hypothetical protein